MRHHTKVVLCFLFAAVVAAVIILTAFMLEAISMVLPLPFEASNEVVGLGIFAFLFILVFDISIVLIEGADS